MVYINLYVEIPPGIPLIHVRSDVVPVDVPALLGLNILDEHLLNTDTVLNRLLKRTIAQGASENSLYLIECSSVPMRRIDIHVYVHMTRTSLTNFSRYQLKGYTIIYSIRHRRSCSISSTAPNQVKQPRKHWGPLKRYTPHLIHVN